MDCIILYIYSNLEEIDSFLPILEKFLCLEAIDLSNNRIRALPPDLSGLKSLRILNINNNPFDDFADTVAALQTLPMLRFLCRNLEQSEEVELVLNTLQNLESLNEQGNGFISYRG